MVQINDFESGTTSGWRIGNVVDHPNPPVNIASGGPAGAEDNFLQTQSNGGSGAGSRLAFFNQNPEWTGDYTIGGVTGITASVINQGSSDVVLRVAFDGAGGRFVTTEGVTVPPGSGWQDIAFDITAADLTAVGGTDVDATLSGVSQIRFINSPTPAYQGIAVAAQVGIDNIATVGGAPDEPPAPPEPPMGDLPVVSFEVVPPNFSEEAADNLVEWVWTVTGDFPEEGITVNLDTSGGDAPFAFTEQFAAEPAAEFVNAEIVGFDDTGRLNILLTAPEASFQLFFINDIIEEGAQTFDFQLVEGEGYAVDPNVNGTIFTITDDNGGPGVGPTIGLSVSATALAEGEPLTVTFAVDGDIPAEGVQVLVQSDVPGSLGQFDLADLGNITTTGIAGLPSVGDGGGGSFFVTIVEPTATISLNVFDDIVAEEPLDITFTLANGELYEVDPAAASTTLTIADEVQPAGPTVSLSVDNPALVEGGDPVTLTITVDGEIPEGGLPVLINDVASASSGVRSLTEFDIANVTTTGLADFPSPAEGDSGFFVTVTEPTATITLAAFDEGADEDEALEQFNFAVIDGEAYEVDPAASSVTVSIADPVADLPVLSFTASTDMLNEAEGTSLTFNFEVAGEFPAAGVVVRFDENFFDTGDQIDFNVFELENLEFFDFAETSPGRFTVDYLLSAPQGSLTTAVFDDNVAEAEFIYNPSILPIPEANYAINPDASSVSVSVVDGVDGTGGPVVNLAVSDTDLQEGDPLTITLTAEGEIPAEGIEINVNSSVNAALGDFISTDENGIPNITTAGFAGALAPNGAASGFSAVMVENTATITLDVVNDGFAEAPETFDFALLDGENYDVSGEAVDITISDADSALPVVSLEVSPTEVTEADDGAAVALNFTVEGEIPAVEFDADGNYVSGGLPVEFDGRDVNAIFEQIVGGPIVDGVEVTRFPADESDTTYEFTLLQNTATVTVNIVDDVIEEAPQDFSFNLIPNPEGPYTVNAGAVGGTVTLTDGGGGPGVGPTVGITVTETELTEADTVTLNFTVVGDIPTDGLEVLVQSPTPGAIGEFSIFDETGNFLIETTGLADFPIAGDGIGSSFIATITEPTASITLSVFDDGPNEGPEDLIFEVINGEEYEVAAEASNVTITIDDGAPVISLTATPEVLNEAEGTILTYNFAVAGEIPEGGLIFRTDDLFDAETNWRSFDFDNPDPATLGGLELVDFERIVLDNGNAIFEVIWRMLEPTGFLALPVLDDEVADDPSSFTVGLIPGDGYAIAPEASEVTIEIIDGITTPGGPLIGMTISDTEVNEGDPLTLTFTTEDSLPDGGQQIFIQSDIQNALGEFITVDAEGNPTITATGFSNLEPIFRGFVGTMTESTATISLNVFDDGPGEGPETFTYTLLDGESYIADPDNNSFAITVDDTSGDSPVVGISVDPAVVSETDANAAFTINFTVDGEIPTPEFDADGNLVSGGLSVLLGPENIEVFNQFDSNSLFEGFVFGENFFGAIPDSFASEIILLENNASLTQGIFNDILEEADAEFSFQLVEAGDFIDSDYVINPEAGSASFTLVDGNGGPGVGPTVSLAVSDTDLFEGDELTVNFDVEGDIPDEGLEVFVGAGGPADLGEFQIFNEDGSPAVELEGINDFPLQGGADGGFFVTLNENQASLTLSVFEDGPTEGPEALTFELGNGELYEVNPDASTVTLNISDGGEAAVFAAESGVTSVFLDFPLLEEVAGLTLVSADSEATPAERPAFLEPFQVGFAITEATDFTFAPVPFTPLGGTIEHTGTITLGLGDAEATIGEFSIGFDESRVSETTSGFFVADTLDDALGLEILFDLSAPGTAAVSNNELEISGTDLLLSPELAGALGLPDLAGADVGDAQIDALVGDDGSGPPNPGAVTDGDDELIGTDADDFLDGLGGSDLYTGGAGADQFGFGLAQGIDAITDFEIGVDQIILGGLTPEGVKLVELSSDTLVLTNSNELLGVVQGVTGLDNSIFA